MAYIATKAERQAFWLEMAEDVTIGKRVRRRAAWLLARSGGTLPEELQFLLEGRHRSRSSSTAGVTVITIIVPLRRRRPEALGAAR